ncbi:hypothetical protein INR49_017831 [Caranx melampygus]|nr:hypothetical protein INR49_017831 [Caranx melampygus]
MDSSTVLRQQSRSKVCSDFMRQGEKFQPDHAALLSILRNEGVSTAGLGSPQSKPYNYLPQRVSVMKSRQKAGPTAGVKFSKKQYNISDFDVCMSSEAVFCALLMGVVKLVQFSPDAAALQSILQNEGVKAAGASTRKSVCQSGRGTSIYTAQRVPVRKNHAEAPGGPVAGALSEPPLKKWTPKRVRDTRHQPMSAMEEVIQRLFDDPEDEENAETQAERPPAQDSSTNSRCEEKVEKSRTNAIKDEEQLLLLQQQRIDQHGPVSSEQRKVQPETSSVLEPAAHINPPVQSLHRDISVQKSCGLSPAVALLRKRLPPLEELRMDEEVATYTSVSVSVPSGFLPPRPRCGNPLAAILHFEESSRFVPIEFDLASGPSSPPSSPLQER